MLRGRKSSNEIRFEWMIVGVILMVVAIIYVIFNNPDMKDFMFPFMMFFPGLILLGSAIYQDMQPDWKAGWLAYAMAILLVASGLAGIVNKLMGAAFKLDWFIVAAVELGAVLIAKALYDPSPRSE